MLLGVCRKTLSGGGVELITPAEGDVFDPHQHNAVEVLLMEAEHEGKIVAVSTLGCRRGTLVLKAADVAVAVVAPATVTPLPVCEEVVRATETSNREAGVDAPAPCATES